MHLALTEVDGFALAMVVMLALSFGVVLLILVAILRNGRRRDAEVEELLSASGGRETEPAPASKPPSRESWEKDPDWWRADSDSRRDP